MKRNRTLRSLAALCVAGLVLTACGGGRGAGGAGQSTGITDTEVTLGGSAPFSGPASAYRTIAQAIQACFAKVNDTGGVTMGDGKTRTINYTVYDDAYEPAQALENTRRLIEQDRVFSLFSVIGTPPNSAIVDYANEMQVPHLFAMTGASKWGAHVEKWPWTMGWQSTYANESGIYAEYLEREHPGATIAILYQNDDVGKDYLSGFKEAIKGSDIRIVAEESYQVADPSVDSQVLNLSRSGADVFFNVTTPKFAAQAIRKKHEIGWTAEHLLTSVSSSVESVLEPAGLDASKGIISAEYIKDPSDPRWQDDPAMRQYLADARKYGDFPVMDELAVTGWAACQTMVRTLEDTSKPTRAALMDAARSMDYTIPMLLPGIRMQTGEGDGFPMEARQLTRFDGEQWAPVGDVISYDG